jgi:hypothetical protein
MFDSLSEVVPLAPDKYSSPMMIRAADGQR